MTDNDKKQNANKEYYLKNKDEIARRRKEKRALINSLLKNSKSTQTAQTAQTPQTDNNSMNANGLKSDMDSTLNLQASQVLQSNRHTDSDSIRVLPIDPNQYTVSNDKPYIQRSNEFELLDLQFSLDESKGVILVGRSGTGKTFMCKKFAQKNNVPLVLLTCHENVRDHQLLGSFQLVNGESVYVLGALPTAIEIANRHPSKKVILVLDELNTLENPTQKILNENLNFHEGIYVPALNQTFKLNEGSQIIVIGTMNPSGSYLGTNELNREFTSRFLFIDWNDWTDKELKQLITSWKIDEQTADQLIDLNDKIKAGYENQELSIDQDSREITKQCEIYNKLKASGKSHDESLKMALKLGLVSKFGQSDPKEVKTVSEFIESIFGIEV